MECARIQTSSRVERAKFEQAYNIIYRLFALYFLIDNLYIAYINTMS